MKTLKQLVLHLGLQDSLQIADENTSIEDFVATCKRGDWLLTIAESVVIDAKLLTLTKGYCAKTIYELMPTDNIKAAVDAAIKYGNNEIDINQLEDAYNLANYDYRTTTGIFDSIAAGAACAAAIPYTAPMQIKAFVVASMSSTAILSYKQSEIRKVWALQAKTNENSECNRMLAHTEDFIQNLESEVYANAAAAAMENKLQTADICRKYIGQQIIDKVNQILSEAN